MTSTFALLLVVMVSLSVSTILVLVLAHPLRLILGQLCPGNAATTFWVAFTVVMLYLAPLLVTVMLPTTAPSPYVVEVIRAALVTSLTGAFAALLVVGYRLAK